MNFLELTKVLVESVIPDKEQVSFKQYEENGTLIIEVLTSDLYMKYVIGKKGSVANSIRTIVQASGYINNKKVLINFDSF